MTIRLSIGVWRWLCDRRILPFADLGQGICVEKCLDSGGLTEKATAGGAAWHLQRSGRSIQRDRSSSQAKWGRRQAGQRRTRRHSSLMLPPSREIFPHDLSNSIAQLMGNGRYELRQGFQNSTSVGKWMIMASASPLKSVLTRVEKVAKPFQCLYRFNAVGQANVWLALQVGGVGVKAGPGERARVGIPGAPARGGHSRTRGYPTSLRRATAGATPFRGLVDRDRRGAKDLDFPRLFRYP